MKHNPLALFTLAACALTASAQVTLDIKHTEKSTLTQESEVTLKQILVIAGQEIETLSHQKFTIESATGARAADGSLNTKATFTKWNGKWAFPGGIEMKSTPPCPTPRPRSSSWSPSSTWCARW